MTYPKPCCKSTGVSVLGGDACSWAVHPIALALDPQLKDRVRPPQAPRDFAGLGGRSNHRYTRVAPCPRLLFIAPLPPRLLGEA